jgi:hypothetical protein
LPQLHEDPQSADEEPTAAARAAVNGLFDAVNGLRAPLPLPHESEP